MNIGKIFQVNLSDFHYLIQVNIENIYYGTIYSITAQMRTIQQNFRKPTSIFQSSKKLTGAHDLHEGYDSIVVLPRRQHSLQ